MSAAQARRKPRCYTGRQMRRLGMVLVLCSLGCSDAPTDQTPSGTMRLFIDAMDRAEHDESALRDAYVLLAAPTRRALLERAHLAGSLGGRLFQPWEMLVRGRYRESFAPREGTSGMRESIDGDTAFVVVEDDDGTHTARVPMVREEGRWRIAIEIPDRQ